MKEDKGREIYQMIGDAQDIPDNQRNILFSIGSGLSDIREEMNNNHHLSSVSIEGLKTTLSSEIHRIEKEQEVRFEKANTSFESLRKEIATSATITTRWCVATIIACTAAIITALK